jgi:hypothetical protein
LLDFLAHYRVHLKGGDKIKRRINMKNYAELSVSQRAVIDIIRHGGMLSFIFHTGKFQLLDKDGTKRTMNNTTGNSLALGYYILEAQKLNDKTIYKLNPKLK